MLTDIVRKIHLLLIRNNKTIAVAESCTGGLLSKLLTDLSGSSGYFLLGVVTYSNQAKTAILNIPDSLINKEGAVSRAVAELMAKSVRKLSRADFGIGITGIAGPAGGTHNKPKGTVFIALNSRNKTTCQRFNFSGSRSAVRNKAALESLRLLASLIK